MFRPPVKTIGALSAAAFLFALPAARAGDVMATPDKNPAPPPEVNPLSFYDGKIVFDFQERLRWENASNVFDFNSHLRSKTDGNWFDQRVRLGIAIKPLDWLKFYAQGQDSREFNNLRGNIPGLNASEGDNAFNLRQAYAELADYDRFPLGLKVGRQVLAYGDERLVGEFDWNNFSRTFDAVKATYKGRGFWIDAFTSTPVVIRDFGFNQSDFVNGDELNRKLVFSGLYFSADSLPFGVWDLYTFMLDQPKGNTTTFQGILSAPPVKGSLAAHSDFATIGTRIKGDPKKLDGWEFGGEFAYQIGTVRGLDLNAFAGTAGIGYNWLKVPWQPRLYAEFNYASGDDSPANSSGGVTGESIHTFQNLFPTNHLFYGIMDNFAWQNMENLKVCTRITPLKNVTLELSYYAYWLADTNDAWYRSNGVTTVRPLNAAARNADSYAGSELDLVATWNVNKHLQFQGGFAHFFAGSYLRDTGAADDSNLGYLQAKITF